MLNSSEDFSLSGRITYLFLVFITGLVCVYDNILNIMFAKGLPEAELNPICLALINYYGVTGFILIKAATTIIGILTLILLIYTKFRVCIPIMFFLSMLLFFYLTFYDSSGDYTMLSMRKERGAFCYVLDFYLNRDIEKIMENLTYNNPYTIK